MSQNSSRDQTLLQQQGGRWKAAKSEPSHIKKDLFNQAEVGSSGLIR